MTLPYLTLLFAPDARVSLRAVHPDAFDAYAELARAHGCTMEEAREFDAAKPYWAASRIVVVGNVERQLGVWARAYPGHNLYAQVSSVRPGHYRGGLDSLECARALWVDVDGAAGIDSLDALMARCEAIGAPPPSMVVRTSERGWHTYWGFSEGPFPMTTPMAQHSFRRVLYGLAARLGGDLRATDPARVLRPPGTVNHPSSAKRATGRGDYAVEVVHFDPFLRYGRNVLRQFAADPPPSVAVSDTPQFDRQPYAGELPWRAAIVLECDPDARDRFDGLAHELADQSDSAIDLALARVLSRHELDGWEIEHALRYSRETVRQCAKRQDDRHYIRTVNRVLAED